ncbi:MAG: penicillin-binding protein, partial [Dialister micraerophilus]|nr:penicillin-binding protein [Dialister micraerophilus]
MKIRNPRNIMRQRSRSISLVLVGIGCLLGLRLLWVQGIQGAKFAEMAINQTEGIQTLYSPRGTIYDRNGKQLAFSVMVKSLYADPGMINVSAEDAAKELAPILNIKEDVLKKDLSGKTRFVWLKRIMDPQDSDKVEALIKEKKWKGFAFVNESKRYYPNGVLLSNVLGFVGVDDKGLDGLEMSLDSLIRGDINKQILLTDARGNPILDSSMAPYKAKEEKSVYLTIDQNIQFYA